ncbi:MAG: sigma-70 family RNA polymerase sigma factor [Clostridiales bacterium]|nr:sigma-70 family RNA polymerase sigma factor [Clostridiales bacterium]
MDSKELEQIYNEAYRPVYWTAISLLKNKDDAEDVVQDTFVTLIRSYDTIADRTKVVPWLKKVCANKCLDRIKLSKTDNVEDDFFDDVEAVPEDFLPSSIVESEEKRRIIMDIIDNSLSEDIKRTLILFYFDEMTTAEIAEKLAIPQGTVLWRLNFARKKIKKEVEKYEEDNDTKLYAMVLPFLTQLFMKEAEQVPLRPMPASLINLSASYKAPHKGEGTKLVSDTIREGTGIMTKKLLAIIIAAVLAAGAITGGIIWFIGRGDKDKKDRKTRSDETKVEEEERDDGNDYEDGDGDADHIYDPDDDGLTDGDDPSDIKTTQVITEDSIFFNMDDLTEEELIANVWKTADVYEGMTRKDYEGNFVKDEYAYFTSLDDAFYWQYRPDDYNDFISHLDVEVKLEDDTITGISEYSYVDVIFHIEDYDRADKVFNMIIDKYVSEGYEISLDVGELSEGSRSLNLIGENLACSISAFETLGYNIHVVIPIM